LYCHLQHTVATISKQLIRFRNLIERERVNRRGRSVPFRGFVRVLSWFRSQPTAQPEWVPRFYRPRTHTNSKINDTNILTAHDTCHRDTSLFSTPRQRKSRSFAIAVDFSSQPETQIRKPSAFPGGDNRYESCALIDELVRKTYEITNSL